MKRGAGLSAAQVEALIARLNLGLTFTAHPTEMRRRTVRSHLEDVARELPDLERESAQERVAAHVEALWRTPEPADISCTSPGRISDPVPMLSRWARTPSSTTEMISMSAWPWVAKPAPGRTRSSLITRSGPKPMCLGS
jgi:hypothetical protein